MAGYVETHTPAKKPAHIFVKSLFGVGTILFLGTGILLRGQKPKLEFQRVTGPVLSYSKSQAGHSDRHDGKMRYLRVAGYAKVFEIFIGKDAGDFKPSFEQLDNLALQDVVTAYYDEDTSIGASPVINRRIQFIDKGDQPFYIRGNKDKYGGYFFIGIGLVMTVTLLLLKKAGKIE